MSIALFFKENVQFFNFSNLELVLHNDMTVIQSRLIGLGQDKL